MVKDIKYIIKRILIGVGVVLVLSFLRGNLLIGANAKEITSIWQPFNNHVATVDNLDTTVLFTPSSSGNWANWGFGILRFNFSIIKVAGDPTAPLVVPNNVSVNNYVCDVSSTSVGNSTFTGSTYSASCPMIMGSTGLGNMYILLTGNQQNLLSTYRITVGGLLTFEKVEDVTLDTSGTTGAINNQITNDNSNTQSIINNNNSNTSSIINNQNSNTQDIINNQNANNQAQIESQKVCTSREYTIDDTNKGNKFLTSNGSLSAGVSSGWGITDYLAVDSNSVATFSDYYGNGYNCWYDSSKTVISCFRSSGDISPPSDAKFLRVSIRNVGSNNQPKFSLKTCINGNQAIVNSQQDLNNTLKDTTGGDVSSSWFDDFRDNSNSPVSDLLTMPITLMQAYLDGFGGNCQAMNLGQLYGTYIIIPCISIVSFLGEELWALIDMLFSLFMVYNLGMLCVSIYEGITGLQDDMQFLYSPQHAGAGNTRVERNSDNY